LELPLSLEAVLPLPPFSGTLEPIPHTIGHWLIYYTYTTHGNIGLMCWAFELFDIGFITTILVRSTLIWYSRPPLP
jgi:hypothetical protein